MGDKLTRRAALACLGSGALVAAVGSSGFDSVTGARAVSVTVGSGADALLGIVGQGPVQKNGNQQEPMVEYTNNTDSTLTVTTELDNCSDGTLDDREDESGCKVTIDIRPGNSKFVDISADTTGTITYGISASSSDLTLETSGSVEAEAGNVKGAVRIKDPDSDKDFTANAGENVFEIKKVDIQDNDGDDDLDLIEFRVSESSSGDTVASKDIDNPPGSGYKATGNPGETIDPDSGYAIRSGTTYKLTVKAFDADDNSASETVEDTA